jgi:hypothetical protein
MASAREAMTVYPEAVTERSIDWVFSEPSRCQRMARYCHRDVQQIVDGKARQCIARNLEEIGHGQNC